MFPTQNLSGFFFFRSFVGFHYSLNTFFFFVLLLLFCFGWVCLHLVAYFALAHKRDPNERTTTTKIRFVAEIEEIDRRALSAIRHALVCSFNEFLELILSWIKVVCDIYGKYRNDSSSSSLVCVVVIIVVCCRCSWSIIHQRGKKWPERRVGSIQYIHTHTLCSNAMQFASRSQRIAEQRQHLYTQRGQWWCAKAQSFDGIKSNFECTCGGQTIHLLREFHFLCGFSCVDCYRFLGVVWIHLFIFFSGDIFRGSMCFRTQFGGLVGFAIYKYKRRT